MDERSSFGIVPVIDLKSGAVVRARAGERKLYAPIVTPLASGHDPVDVARGLLNALPAHDLYVADLDAIAGSPLDLASLRRIADALPEIRLWVDAGFATAEAVEAFLDTGLGRPVLGSESQTDPALVARHRATVVLSLDTLGERPLGPPEIHADPACWPDDVIVMTLSRVGTAAGPDIERIEAVRAQAPSRKVFAAGGVRNWEDIEVLRLAGAAGALVSTAIHDGRLSMG